MITFSPAKAKTGFNPVPYWMINVILIAIFLFFQFMNLSYPLMWGDESITAMYGQRVLKYGYPKVHDNKNVLFDLSMENIREGIDEKTDAFTGGNSWLEYYVAAIPLLCIDKNKDIYHTTLALRIPFLVAGILGLLVLSLILFNTIPGKRHKHIALSCFIFLEIISVSITLHLREVRYYSLVILFFSLVLLVFWLYHFRKKINFRAYFILIIILMFLCFHTFYPLYFILVLSFIAFELLTILINRFVKPRSLIHHDHKHGQAVGTPQKPLKSILKNLSPFILSFILVLPFILYFNLFSVSHQLGMENEYNLDYYMFNLSMLLRYFSVKEAIYTAVILKLILFFNSRKIFSGNLYFISYLSFLFSVIFIVYSIIIPRIPNDLFTRYFIVLQPLLSLIIVLDCYILIQVIRQYARDGASYYIKIMYAFLILSGVFLIHNNKTDLSGLVFQSTHRYKGDLDYIIPYIKDNYKHTDSLIIATNCEETSFMFYLDAKTIVGFVGNNLKEDTLYTPDIIIYRPGWGNMVTVFHRFLNRSKYNTVCFPVANHPLNNIPELNNTYQNFNHLFKTLRSKSEKLELCIFCKQQNSASVL